MVKKCVYCNCSLEDSVVVDVCEGCGVGVWGKKMFQAIIDNMSKAREKGDLNQGIISYTDANSDDKFKGKSL